MDECPACGTSRSAPPPPARTVEVERDRAELDSSAIASGPACPYCGAAMQAGAIVGDRYRLKWLPRRGTLLLGILALGAVPIGERQLLSRPRASGHRCLHCRTIIVDR
ncbi:MAG: PF20097 family protein [Planctomycetales bacterium]